MSFQGIFGKPRKLVTDATKRLCSAINEGEPKSTVKYILMNTVEIEIDLPEKISFSEKCIIWLLRLLVPPHIVTNKLLIFCVRKLVKMTILLSGISSPKFIN